MTKSDFQNKTATITLKKVVYDLLMSKPFKSSKYIDFAISLLIIFIVKKGKACKYVKLAVSDARRKLKPITKYRVLSLAEYKTAKSANKLGETKLISKIVPEHNLATASVEMKQATKSEVEFKVRMQTLCDEERRNQVKCT
jgi:hypothetical protein